jgi:iron complex outermembrane receptor protein
VITEESQAVQIVAGQSASIDFTLDLQALRHEITVTAEGKQLTAFESFQSVDSLDSFDLAENANISLGESLSNRVGSGIAKRSFGPGSSRPIIRGFDGDRVLVMEDGIRVGSLASQSGDHGEPLNLAQVDRLEVVKGPATLLYGSNAMGGTINAVSRHHSVHTHPHDGLRAYASSSAGTTANLGAANAGFEYGLKNWMAWGSGGGIRSGDYDTPIGTVFNSRARQLNGSFGLGFYGDRHFFSSEVEVDDGSNGVPFAQDFEEGTQRIFLNSLRRAYSANWGMRNLQSRAIDNFTLKLRYIDWTHQELEQLDSGEEEVGTAFSQGQFIYRAVFEQKAKGSWKAVSASGASTRPTTSPALKRSHPPSTKRLSPHLLWRS